MQEQFESDHDIPDDNSDADDILHEFWQEQTTSNAENIVTTIPSSTFSSRGDRVAASSLAHYSHTTQTSPLLKLAVRFTLDTFNSNYVESHFIGSIYGEESIPLLCCQYCGAFYWEEEKTTRGVYTTCCAEGKIKCALLEPPSQLMQHLFESSDQDAREFRANIRAVNSSLAFACTTYVGNEGKNVRRFTSGPPVFIVHGNVQHDIGSIMPPIQHQLPSFMQVYFVDTNTAQDNNSIQEYRDFSENLVCCFYSSNIDHNSLTLSVYTENDRSSYSTRDHAYQSVFHRAEANHGYEDRRGD
jgi:hypothetical protein